MRHIFCANVAMQPPLQPFPGSSPFPPTLPRYKSHLRLLSATLVKHLPSPTTLHEVLMHVLQASPPTCQWKPPPLLWNVQSCFHSNIEPNWPACHVNQHPHCKSFQRLPQVVGFTPSPPLFHPGDLLFQRSLLHSKPVKLPHLSCLSVPKFPTFRLATSLKA